MRRQSAASDEWISISDLMSGLMLVFLAIAVFFMHRIEQDRQDLEQVALLYDSVKRQLYEALREEFREDLPIWGAELDPVTLAIRFENPDVLFETGDSAVTERFQQILGDFFPRYVDVLRRDAFRDQIEEVRIEGHTSSDWLGSVGLEAYEQNMDLSQKRTRSVLSHVVRLPGVREHWADWLQPRLTANGLSSSRPIQDGGAEDPVRSRRVEFRVRTDADERLRDIVDRIRLNDSARN